MAATRDIQETGARGGLRSGAVSGFATGLFSIPEGMAYAQLAGVDPVFGLYSGMVATLVASLTTGTILMISTLTSAIALTVGSILDESGLGGDALPGALFTITLLTGAVMLLMGLLKMGGLVDFVSNAVMTGFVMGASLLIVIGELGDFSGYDPEGANKLAEVWDWFANIGSWDGATTTVALATVALMLVLKGFRPTEKAAAVAALIVMTIVVAIWSPDSVALVRDIAEIPNSLPTPVLPDLSVIPDVALGSIAVALVALVQGAGISTAYPNPGGRPASQNRDFIGEGLGNVAGAFFQSMPTGGSLSRTGISVSAGAGSRWGGTFAAVWLGLLVLLFGNLAELVPLSVIAGLLFVIAGELILARVPSFVLVLRTSPMSVAAMLATFLTALFVPLQWTI
ncbi:MAG TPA: SulP family inorganic anion transporter, partial [Acidimicrobiia bacterium]|nr:SulP family inorganic anion transporter [Acidimicrobiia bacterium]